ncbi:MAG: glycosyltransferase family 2 protein [Pseudomonadota bacterium]
MNYVEILLWVSMGLVFYTYVGYPILLRLLPQHAETYKDSFDGRDQPIVTLIIAAYNEEAFIGDKIQNSLNVDDEGFDFRIVVVSDGSEDRTNEIASTFVDERLTFIPLQPRGGKANALNAALEIVDGDFVVFTDANVFLEPAAIQQLLNRYIEAHVGVVTGCVELQAFDDEEPLGEGAYMQYERWLQLAESKYWSVAGVDGALFAIRRELVNEIPKDTVLDDFLIGVRAALGRARIVYEPNAKALEKVPAEVSQEFRRKTRIAAGCFQFLNRIKMADFLASPRKFQFAFFSHKLLRWYVPFLLILVFVLSALLIGQPFYTALLVIQLIAYGLAAMAHYIPSLRGVIVFYIPYYFAAMNCALLVGWWRQKRSGQSVTWKRVDR